MSDIPDPGLDLAWAQFITANNHPIITRLEKELAAARAEIERLTQQLAEARAAAYAGWVGATGYPIAEWVYEYHPWLRDYKPEQAGGGDERTL